ncbi:putative transcriptional regulatory protein [Labeo rohita]|uniref:Transcriptional regulatory protein n=1 Tax=Labeo rohita TaxID=84645 RepID=A0ABQ8M533_LABRO|nr:putative transcriptional regulatory protein [Labeo rohita]
MGKTADMTMVQKTIIDTLHEEKKLGRKRCTSNRDDRKLEKTVKQSRFKHLEELHKEWNEAGVSASRVTTLRCLKEKGYQATSETETMSEASYLG